MTPEERSIYRAGMIRHFGIDPDEPPRGRGKGIGPAEPAQAASGRESDEERIHAEGMRRFFGVDLGRREAR